MTDEMLRTDPSYMEVGLLSGEYRGFGVSPVSDRSALLTVYLMLAFSAWIITTPFPCADPWIFWR